MPTKNIIDLSAGELYILHPETGERVCLGALKSLEATTTRSEYVDDLGVVNPCLAVPPEKLEVTIEMEPAEAWETFQEMVVKPGLAAVAEMMTNMARKYYAWCVENHPDWVNILRRTKKKRTRKKYMDRLRRAFLEEV